MTQTARLALACLAGALVFGLLADVFDLSLDQMGVNFLLSAAAFAGVFFYLCRRQGISVARQAAWLAAPALLFACFIPWRDSPILAFINLLAVAMLFALIALRRDAGALALSPVAEYPLGILKVLFLAPFGPFSLFFKETRWEEISKVAWHRKALIGLRGVLVATPFLLLFGGLFSSADAAFRFYVSRLFDWDLPDLWTYVCQFLVWAWLAAGMFRALTMRDWSAQTEKQRTIGRALSFPEIAVALGLLDLLFLAFVIVQFHFFFGGAQYVRETIGMTYTQYARGGFFELVWVSFLVLPLLLVAHAQVPIDSGPAQRLFTILAGCLVALLFLIMASAIQRMRLYEIAFGLTQERLYVSAFMGWLAMVFAWFLATVLRGQRERFAFGALVAGFAVLFALDIVNPDSLIARVNLSRPNVAKSFDAYYITDLSADAVPDVVAGLPKMSKEAQGYTACYFLQQWQPDGPTDWRHWNWARSLATRVVAAHLQELGSLNDHSCED